jgi:hypothetical protein
LRCAEAAEAANEEEEDEKEEDMRAPRWKGEIRFVERAIARAVCTISPPLYLVFPQRLLAAVQERRARSALPSTQKEKEVQFRIRLPSLRRQG